VAVDKRWADVRFWRAVADSTNPYTDRYLLAALDYERDASGSIAALPAEASANSAILLRTLGIGAIVTLACALIGLPYAMLVASDQREDRKSTRLNSSHVKISYAVFCLKKKTNSAENFKHSHKSRNSKKPLI